MKIKVLKSVTNEMSASSEIAILDERLSTVSFYESTISVMAESLILPKLDN